MPYCIVCKEIVDKRYALSTHDSKLGTKVEAYVCRDCFNHFLASHANEGMFKAWRFLGWAKNRDRIRD